MNLRLCERAGVEKEGPHATKETHITEGKKRSRRKLGQAARVNSRLYERASGENAGLEQTTAPKTQTTYPAGHTHTQRRKRRQTKVRKEGGGDEGKQRGHASALTGIRQAHRVRHDSTRRDATRATGELGRRANTASSAIDHTALGRRRIRPRTPARGRADAALPTTWTTRGGALST